MKHILSLALIGTVIILGGAGCSRSINERVTERALEQTAGGNADVDLANGQVNINVNGASWQAGSDVELPNNFPPDVYVIDGKIISVVAGGGTEDYTVSIQSNTTVADAAAQYRQKLVEQRWVITASANYGQMENIVATMGNRTLNVVIVTGENNNALVTLSEAVPEDWTDITL